MNSEHELLMSNEDEELKRIKETKLKELVRRKKETHEMNAKPVHVSDAIFSKMVQENPLALIDCWASWCGPCVALAPTIDELAKEYAGKVFIGKLDVDENPKTAESFKVFSIPTMLIMKNGVEVDRIVGLCPKKQIEDKLKKHMG